MKCEDWWTCWYLSHAGCGHTPKLVILLRTMTEAMPKEIRVISSLTIVKTVLSSE